MAGVRKRTAEGADENPVQVTDTESTASAKQSADVGTEATAKSKSSSTTKKKSTAGAKTATSAKPEVASDTAEKKPAATKKGGGSATKQAGTQSGAKKTAQGKSTATGTTAKKATTGSTKSTTKKSTAGEKKAASPKAKPASEAPKSEESATENLPALPLIDADALVSVTRGEIGEAHPPVDFPKETVKRGFFARLGVLLLLVAVLTASVFIYLHRPSSYVERTNAVNFLYVGGENKTDVMVNGVLRGSLNGALQSSTHNARGDVYAAVVGNTLYLIRGKNIISVAENVQDYQLSADGTAIAYRTAENYLYYRKAGKRDEASLISKGCISAAYCLSSDGRELIYTYQREADSAALLQIESFTGSKPYIESVAGLVPVAVSPKCRYIYFTDESGALFIYNSKKGERVKCAAAPDKGTLTFNRDCTELLFTEGGATVLFVKGERCQIVGAAAKDALELLPNRRVAILPCKDGVQYMTASFLNAYYLHLVGTGKQLAHLDRRGKLTDISFVDDKESITVTDKGVFFLLTDKSSTDTHTVLYRVKPRKTSKDLLAWDVAGYQTNVDGSHVLYTGHQDALYAWSTTGETKRICDSVLPDSLCVTADDLFCFYRTDGVLAVSDNGRAVRDIAEGVQGFLVDTHSVFYVTASADGAEKTLHINYRNARLGESLGSGYTDFH